MRFLCSILLLLVAICIVSTVNGFGLIHHNPTSRSSLGFRSTTTTTTTYLSKSQDDKQDDDDDDEESWDEGVDYDKEFPTESSTSPDPSSAWNAPLSKTGLENMVNDDGTPKLGIDIGGQLKPLTEQEAAELRAEATELINDAVAAGLDDIEKLRTKMKRELEQNKKAMEFASDLNMQRETENLMNKIDKLTGDFMTKTESSRESTKLASKADQAMQGKGIEVGSWGVLGGASVLTSGPLLGSVASNTKETKSASASSSSTGGNFLSDEALFASSSSSFSSETKTETESTENRIMIVADTSQDKMAKQIIPEFTDKLEKAIPGIITRVIKPTETMPLGCDNSACIILFLTSLSDQSSMKNLLERALRRTIQPGSKMGQPPTQIIGISTLGTERYDKLPYSMQNLMGGGKLEKRRQMEEVIVTTIQRRMTSPPLDYTICKFGEIKDDKNDVEVMPGDVLDGNTPVETAVDVMLQAVAYQPFARNATLCATGSSASVGEKDDNDEEVFSFWNDAFLRLDGPELLRIENMGDPSAFDELSEYLTEWSELFAATGKGLTTPITAQPSTLPPNVKYQGVEQRSGVKILFLPTATGKNYMSKEEEDAQRDEGNGQVRAKVNMKNLGKDGGIEILVEVTTDQELRIRAKRCNYADDATLKEISEETILSRLRKAVDSWIANKQS